MRHLANAIANLIEAASYRDIRAYQEVIKAQTLDVVDMVEQSRGDNYEQIDLVCSSGLRYRLAITQVK